MSLRLITIPISHYCDKARWALDRAGLAYDEEAHLQLLHYVATYRAGGGRTVPVLVHPGGVLRESRDILRWTDETRPSREPLYPAASRRDIESLEKQLDDELGPSGRLYMYWHMLPKMDVILKYGSTGVPDWQRRGMRVFLPFVDAFIRRRLGVTEASVAEARTTFMRVFDSVADRLHGNGRFLVGDTFTAADLTFASLAAPLVLPREYGVPLPDLDELPATYAAEVIACREHPAGAFALRMYREHRKSRAPA